MTESRTLLVGDVGGTNARFALATVSADSGVTLDHVHPLPTREHASFEDALAAWESQLPGALPQEAVFALAGPSGADTVRMTNVDWTVATAALKARFGFGSVRLVNDFAAQARAMPALAASAFDTLVHGTGMAGAPIIVLGPGTGLGMALLVPDGQSGWRVIPTEGGHQSFAPVTPLEQTVLERLRSEIGLVSFETVVSGPGLARIYWALGQSDGYAPLLAPFGKQHLRDFAIDELKAAGGRIGAAALAGNDALAGQAADMMVMALATFAGDAILSTGARGGCMIAGGVADKQADRIKQPQFLARLFDKGPIKDGGYFDGVPVRLARDTFAALIGAALMA